MSNTLHVRPEEWEIAKLIFTKHPDMRKVRRKDVALWQSAAQLYFSNLIINNGEWPATIESQEVFDDFTAKLAHQFMYGAKEPSPHMTAPIRNGKYEQWGYREPRLHSFERIGGTIYASAVHSELGHGAEAIVKLLESEKGHKIAKRTCRTEVISEEEDHPFAKLIECEAELAKQLGREYDAYETTPKPIVFLGRIKSYSVKARTFHPYYAGGDLFHLIEYLSTQPEAASPLVQLTLALKIIDCVYQDAYQHRFVHLDIKPRNIMIDIADDVALGNLSVLAYIKGITCRLIDLSNVTELNPGEDMRRVEKCLVTKPFQPPETQGKIVCRTSDFFSTYKTIETFMHPDILKDIERLGALHPAERMSLKEATIILTEKIKTLTYHKQSKWSAKSPHGVFA